MAYAPKDYRPQNSQIPELFAAQAPPQTNPVSRSSNLKVGFSISNLEEIISNLLFELFD